MRANDADDLRSAIILLAADGAHPRAIAAHLGCHRTTVYRVLRSLAPDKRRRRRRRNPVADAARLAVTVARRAEPEAVTPDARNPGADQTAQPAQAPTDPYADLADPDYAAAARSSSDPEVTYARALLRKVLAQLENPALDAETRAQLAVRAASLLSAHARHTHARGAVDPLRSRLLERLTTITQKNREEDRAAAPSALPPQPAPPRDDSPGGVPPDPTPRAPLAHLPAPGESDGASFDPGPIG